MESAMSDYEKTCRTMGSTYYFKPNYESPYFDYDQLDY